MDKRAMIDYLVTFDGIDIAQDSENHFFFYNPDSAREPDRRLPFVTLVTNDAYDQVSQLNRNAVFRLNIGVSHATYRAMFGPQPAMPREAGVIATDHDFTALDKLMPHPIYAAMSWVCILNPSEQSFEAVRDLLTEAYERAVRRYETRAKVSAYRIPS